MSSTSAAWLRLQREVGNQEVCRIVERSRGTPEQAPQLSGARMIQRAIERGKLNVAGEQHEETEARRAEEKDKLGRAPWSFTDPYYWTEDELTYGAEGQNYGDSPLLRLVHRAVKVLMHLPSVKTALAGAGAKSDDPRTALGSLRSDIQADIVDEAAQIVLEIDRVADSEDDNVTQDTLGAIVALEKSLKVFEAHAGTIDEVMGDYDAVAETTQRSEKATSKRAADERRQELIESIGLDIDSAELDISQLLTATGYDDTAQATALDANIKVDRSAQMHRAAEAAMGQGKLGVWKVGEKHVTDMLAIADQKSYTLTTEDDFNTTLGYQRRDRTQ